MIGFFFDKLGLNRPSQFVTFVCLASAASAGVAICLTIGLPFLDRPSEVRIVESMAPRANFDSSGLGVLVQEARMLGPDATLEELRDAWDGLAAKTLKSLDQRYPLELLAIERQIPQLILKASLLISSGDPGGAYKILEEARTICQSDQMQRKSWLPTIAFFQGLSALRRGENENCIMCRGESSCILPISPAARHTNPAGSKLAIQHFTEYLGWFPDDLEIRWLLNLAHMTLGEYPDGVDRRYLISLDHFNHQEFEIGKFRDIGSQVGVNRFNQAGGAILDDFDNDGRLDLALTSFDATQPMAFLKNRGDGTFEDRSDTAGVSGQYGGLYCVQADYNNDGFLDIYIARGAWLPNPMRPTLLRNNGDGTFADVTKAAGLLDPVNSNSVSWGDFDNDGHIDLFICCEVQTNRLYRNKGDGTFEEISATAGVAGDGRSFCKGAAWIDIDNDGDPDLFLNNLTGVGQLFRNNGDRTFTNVSYELGIDGPPHGFSCWAWDYDNDGWLDIFATCYERSLGDVVRGLIGQPHSQGSNRLFRNNGGKGFVDVTRKAGLDLVFSTMGSNFADFDNDGFLDMYLGTGEPSISTLVPNRMLRNIDGVRFVDITASSGTGNLQKGHAVACGDWDHDGDVDLFAQMGGAVVGDKYHNILFANPGQGNHSLTLKLVGKKTNRAAIGARIKVVSAGDSPRTIHRHVSSGSSFGANTLEQTIGLAKATRIASLEVYWPTSQTTQVFHDIAADQTLEIVEFEDHYRKLDRKPIPTPE